MCLSKLHTDYFLQCKWCLATSTLFLGPGKLSYPVLPQLLNKTAQGLFSLTSPPLNSPQAGQTSPNHHMATAPKRHWVAQQRTRLPQPKPTSSPLLCLHFLCCYWNTLGAPTYPGGKERMSLLLSQGWDATSHAQGCNHCLGDVDRRQGHCPSTSAVLPSENKEPQCTSYSPSGVQSMTAILQKLEEVNLQLMWI